PHLVNRPHLATPTRQRPTRQRPTTATTARPTTVLTKANQGNTTMADEPQTLAVSLVCGTERIDVLVPATLPVTELLPGMVANVGALDTSSATYGFDVSVSSGRVLNPAHSLAQQNVSAGSVLTLAPRAGRDLRRYDDLTEAVGLAVESLRTPWGRAESLTLSLATAAVLAVAAALVLALRPAPGPWSAVAGALAGIIVGLCAAAVAKVAPRPACLSLVVGACALLGAAGWTLAAPLGLAVQTMVGTLGLAVGATSTFLLPRDLWSTAFGPMLVAVCLAIGGLLVAVFGAAWQPAAGVVAAATMLAAALLPTAGLALIALRGLGLPTADAAIPRNRVLAQVAAATQAVAAVRWGIGVVLVVCSPILAHGQMGIALLGCCGASLALGVRNLYARLDVFANTAAAFAALLVGAVVAVWSSPAWSLALCGAMVVCVVVLSLHSLAPARYRPSLERVLDLAYLVTTIAIIPLAALLWRLG
ncbi:MAG: EsaB/YukD family protein, partial [Actinomycetia bacterium]|nr:EsaB/YukD family protein [Actinomycetes bacterium]